MSNLIEYTSSDADIVTVDSKTGELTFTNTKFGEATITATLPKTATYQTSTDSYVVENKDNHIATSLSFNGTDVTLTEGKTDAGADFTGYTATEASNIDGTITYAASGDAVATVDPTTGAVTINAAVYGTTSITATFTPADPTQYSGSTATYQITNKKAVDLSKIVFDVSEDKVSDTGKLTLTKSIVKIHTSNGAFGKYDDYRFYKNSETTFSLTDPTRVITSIKFIHSNTTGPNFTTDKNTYDKASGTWTGYEESVTFTNPGTVIRNITQIIVTTAEKKAAPALSFAEATVTKELVAGTIDLQTITKPEDLDASAITYASSDDTTAKVEGNTTIRLYKTGEVTITATSAATSNYAAGTASYNLIISDSRKDAALAVKENPVKVKLGEGIYNLANNITCDNGLNSETFKYTSSDNSYTIVDNLIEFDKIGTTTITAQFGGNDSYKPAEISYTFEVEDPRTTDADFKFTAESYNADLAEATDGIVTFNAANVLQNPHSLDVTYTISPKSDDATIGETDGEALIEVSGTYTITATAAANDTYKETTATCTLKVINSAVEEKIIEFVAGVNKGGQTGNGKEDQIVQGVVTIHGTDAAFAAVSSNKYTYRLYQNCTTTISTKIGKITKIEFVKGDKPINNLKYNGKDGAFTADTKYDLCWVGSAKEVVFKNTDQARATNIIVTVEVPKAKNYTLDETKTDNVIETYENANVTLQRTLSKEYWNTFCVPFALDAEQVAQYFGEGTQLRTYEGNCNNNIVYFATVDNIEAGKPYIMKPGNAVVQNQTFEGVSMVATGLDENGNPQAVGDASTVQMKGIYNQILLKADKTELFLGDNDLFYYPIDDIDARTIGGLRAYFIVPQGTDIKKLRANLDGTPTSLDTIFDTEESNAPVYNLQGQYVGNSLRALKSGIYIQNGKKVAVK
ncbi:Ig-like domain-containing protein [Leyella stercorea]|uniref:Ig-like domain-containing protein n=1 Tax=Leyella stercorea TaxID=363265 RepID=UPI003FEE4D89